LKFDLRDDFDVLYPWMPSIRNAKYLEWKIMFSKMMEVVDDNIILVGHSLGGIFIVKYLSEEKISKRVKATFLVSAPYDSDGGRKLVEFTIPDSLELLLSFANLTSLNNLE
jgi:predicted alpha/beta hydrolase family esterase